MRREYNRCGPAIVAAAARMTVAFSGQPTQDPLGTDRQLNFHGFSLLLVRIDKPGKLL